MQPIGEQLEEARKRMGIALRDASEATKIRTDYLQAMENGTFDYPLPAVYKRGFLIIYAKFLKLDWEKLAADYNAQFHPSARPGRRDDADNLGRMDAPGRQGSTGAGSSPQENIYSGGAGANTAAADEIKRKAFTRVAVIIVAAVVVVIIGYFAVRALSSGGSTEEKTPAVAVATTENTTTATLPDRVPAAPAPAPVQFVLSALGGNITSLKVLQSSDKKVLFNGKLDRGTATPNIVSQGQAEIYVSQTEYLIIEYDGQKSFIPESRGSTKPQKGYGQYYWPLKP